MLPKTTNINSANRTRVNILLLAAGKARRFQQSCTDANQSRQIKQLADINGIPLLNHCLNQLRPLTTKYNIIDNIYAVLGENHQQILPILPEGIRPLVAKNCSLGIGHTIADSVTSTADNSSHILIALADQALINTRHYQQLIKQSLLEPSKIIATFSANRMMAPAIFPKRYFAELMKLQGDKGAAALLKCFAKQVTTIDCSTAKFDIDTLADLEQISLLIKSTNLCTLSTTHCQNLEPV